MADIISRLKLESGEFDSKIKRASQELTAYSEHCRKTGLEMGYANRDAKAFAQQLGSMSTTATTARGKVSELSDAFVNLKAMYNQMTDAEKRGEFGKNLAASLEQLKQRTQEAKRELSDINSELQGMKAGGGGLLSGDKLSGMLQVFGGNLMTKGAGMLTGLASEIGDLINQGVQLAKQGEGVRIAFERLGRGDILDGLREATHGTVTDIELMKAAVKFNDFKLPVEELGTMLAFAQQKAKDTGQSVDYMVDSIVTGLGRKSLMILDNLGLSATEIRERMKETGDMTKAVGAIIREQMAAAGDYVETAADRAAQANVSLQNKMEELGRKFAPIEEASNQLWTSMKIGILDVIGGPLATLLNSLTDAGRQINTLNRMQGGGKGKPTRTEREIDQFRNSTNQNATYNNIRANYDFDIISRRAALKRNEQEYKDNLKAAGRDTTAQRGALEQYNTTKARLEREITSLETMKADVTATMKEMMKPVEVNIKTTKAIKGISDLKKQLKGLEEQRKKAVKAGDDEQVELLTKQINQTKQNIGYLDPNALKTGGKTEKTDDFTEIIGLIGNAQERVSDLQRQISESWDEGEIARLKEDLKGAQKELKRLQDIGKPEELAKGISGFNQLTMNAWMQGRQGDLQKAEFGSSDYSKIMANIADMNTIKTILEQSMSAGIDAAQFDLAPLWEKVFDGENIDDKVWQPMVNKINEKLKEMNVEPIQIDFKTGNVKGKSKDTQNISGTEQFKKTMGDISQVTNGVTSIVSGIQQLGVEIPEGMSKVLGAINVVTGIITTIASLVTIITATSSAKSVPIIGWLLAGGGIVHAANGYTVPGNNYSGDMVPAMLNSGELVLNRAQQGNLAAQLEGNNLQNLNLTATIRGEQIRLALNNNGRRTGRGEYVQSNRQ